LSVGTSIPGTRSGAAMPIARSLPATTCGANSCQPLTPTVTWPPRIELSASPPPPWAM
jgi:hypothetical protein